MTGLGPDWMRPDRTAAGLELPFVTKRARDRFQDWGCKKMLAPPMILNEEAIEEMGQWEEIDAFLHDPKWRYLLFLRAPASLRLTIEFLCSLEFFTYSARVRTVDNVVPSVRMQFTLLGMSYDIPVRDLGHLLGIYTHEESRSPDFANLPNRLPADVDIDGFWRTHSRSTRPFSNKHSSSSDWRSPAWRILSHVLCCSYFGRHKNANRVYDSHMLFFWSLQSHTPVDLATFVGRFLLDQSTGNQHHIQAGPVVTLLARALRPDIVIPELIPKTHSVRPITVESLHHMGFRKRPRREQTGRGADLPGFCYGSQSRPIEGTPSLVIPPPLPTSFEELTRSLADLRTSIDSRFRRYEQQWTAYQEMQETRWKAVQDHQQRMEDSMRAMQDHQQRMEDNMASQGGQLASILDILEGIYEVGGSTGHISRAAGRGNGHSNVYLS